MNVRRLSVALKQDNVCENMQKRQVKGVDGVQSAWIASDVGCHHHGTYQVTYLGFLGASMELSRLARGSLGSTG
jgi:hypothetical protein